MELKTNDFYYPMPSDKPEELKEVLERRRQMRLNLKKYWNKKEEKADGQAD